MAEIFGYPIMGGGGSDLNFKVIAVATESALPSTAAENTIAVITTTPITSYVFSSTAPTSPTEGMVWFATETASTVGFNAIKRNGLWVYPTGCQQYVSGAWIAKTAKTYRDGAWQDWVTYLFNYGLAGYTFGSGMGGYSAANQGVATVLSNALSLKVSGSGCAIAMYTTRKANFAGFNYLTAKGGKRQDNQNETRMAVSTSTGDVFLNGQVAYLDIGYSSNGADWTLDVTALNGEYYVGWYLATTKTVDSTTLAISQAYLRG